MSSNFFNPDHTTICSNPNTETVVHPCPSSQSSLNSHQREYSISWSNLSTGTCDQLSIPPCASNSTFYNQCPNSKLTTHLTTLSKYVELSPASNTVSEIALSMSPLHVF